MKKVNNYMIAEAGKVLVTADGRGIRLPYKEGADYQEEDVDKDVKHHPDGSIGVIGLNMKPVDVKKKIIKYLFSYDDQIAIMLNKDQSNEAKEVYDFMQRWRDFAGELAKLIN